MADNQDKLATHIRDLVDLLHEADHYASEDGSDAVDAAHVQRAIAHGRGRRGRARELVLESELRGQVQLRTQGEQIDQPNGMSVVMLGRAPFGDPSTSPHGCSWAVAASSTSSATWRWAAPSTARAC